MTEIIIDGNTIISTADIHELIAEKLCFPEYYGKNLDALFDCLTDVSKEVLISLENTDILEERLGIGYKKICRVIRDAADENKNIKIRLN